MGFSIRPTGSLLSCPPDWVASLLTWLDFSHLVWGGVGMFFLARRLKGSPVAACVAALAWSLAGYNTSQWTAGLRMVAGAWIPWVAVGHLALLDSLRVGRRRWLPGRSQGGAADHVWPAGRRNLRGHDGRGLCAWQRRSPSPCRNGVSRMEPGDRRSPFHVFSAAGCAVSSSLPRSPRGGRDHPGAGKRAQGFERTCRSIFPGRCRGLLASSGPPGGVCGP